MTCLQKNQVLPVWSFLWVLGHASSKYPSKNLLGNRHITESIRIQFCCRKQRRKLPGAQVTGKLISVPHEVLGWAVCCWWVPLLWDILTDPGPPVSCPQATSWSKVFSHPSRSLLPHSSQQDISRAVGNGTDGHQLSFEEVSQRLPQNTSA